MEVIVTEQDGIAIVELAGRMDATTTPEFENATRALLETGKQRLLIDMSRWNISAPPVCGASWGSSRRSRPVPASWPSVPCSP